MSKEGEELDLEVQGVLSGLAATIFLTSLLPKTDLVLEVEDTLCTSFTILKDMLVDETDFTDTQLCKFIKENTEKMAWVESCYKNPKKGKKRKKKES